jgi:hypothetical protein
MPYDWGETGVMENVSQHALPMPSSNYAGLGSVISFLE